MSIKLKETPEQIELIRAMGSKDPAKARQATEAIAAFLGPVIKQVLQTAGTASQIYKDAEFDEDDSPSIPLDLFYNEGPNMIPVWSQSMSGGLPTAEITGVKELKLATYRLDSAVSFNKRYARKSRLDVVSKAVERMIQEVLIKQERNAWAVILKALAEASTTPYKGSALKHVIGSVSENYFRLADLNKLMTRITRINESFSGNTPANVYSNGITDLYVSPEIKEQIRAFAYNPINTTGAATNTFDQTLDDTTKREIFSNAGMQSIYGVNIVQLVELGAGKKYNTLFDRFATGQSLPGAGSGNWAVADDEILIGVDNTRDAFIRPVARQSEVGSTFTVQPDGQFDMYGSRVEKVGFYGSMEEGRVCIDARAIVGIVV